MRFAKIERLLMAQEDRVKIFHEAKIGFLGKDHGVGGVEKVIAIEVHYFPDSQNPKPLQSVTYALSAQEARKFAKSMKLFTDRLAPSGWGIYGESDE